MGEVDRLAEATKLAEHFRLGDISLSDIADRIFEKQSGTDRALIVVDQFEELYTLTADEEIRRCFLGEILRACSRVGSKVKVVLTLRGDFVGNALASRTLSDRGEEFNIGIGSSGAGCGNQVGDPSGSRTTGNGATKMAVMDD
jgi:hypothetical protein